jgi:hypothetical protein
MGPSDRLGCRLGELDRPVGSSHGIAQRQSSDSSGNLTEGSPPYGPGLSAWLGVYHQLLHVPPTRA